MTSGAVPPVPSVEDLIYKHKWEEVRKQLKIIHATGPDVAELLHRLADDEDVPEDIIGSLFEMRVNLNQVGSAAPEPTPAAPQSDPISPETTDTTYILLNPFPPEKKKDEPIESKKSRKRATSTSRKSRAKSIDSSNKKNKRNTKNTKKRIDEDLGDDMGGYGRDSNKTDGSVFLDQRVAKDFDQGIFYGTVTGFVPKKGTASKVDLWTVTYSDGDFEDYERHELQALLKEYKNKHEKHDPIFDQD